MVDRRKGYQHIMHVMSAYDFALSPKIPLAIIVSHIRTPPRLLHGGDVSISHCEASQAITPRYTTEVGQPLQTDIQK